ncbi:MAG: photosynthetic reaction center subunit H [Alsobacter sp.]
MLRGALTEHLDVAQVVLYAFWVFFAGLVFYIRREDRREGYPLETDKGGDVYKGGFPFIPDPKRFVLAHGAGTVLAPNGVREPYPVNAVRTGNWPGAPLEPTGNPLLAGVGPGAYAQRADRPELTHHGDPKIVPLRGAPSFSLSPEDPDPRGFTVIGCDKAAGGTVTDLWIDQGELLVRYLEVNAGGNSVLVPMTFALVEGKRGTVYVHALRGKQMADVPQLRNADVVTMLEEEKITAYFGAGTLYAIPTRAEPLL